MRPKKQLIDIRGLDMPEKNTGQRPTKNHIDYRVKSIDDEDIKKYVDMYSPDFTLELKVLNTLKSLGFECEHSGTYADPVTNIVRQFDIRAHKELFTSDQTKIFQDDPEGDGHEYEVNNILTVYFAMECKNIGKTSPLLVHCVPREQHESFYCILHSFKKYLSSGTKTHLELNQELYTANKLVAKSIDKVAYNQDGRFIRDNTDIFDKYKQAINSAYDLIYNYNHNNENHYYNLYKIVIPILVVPDDMLWSVEYNEHGDVVGKPTKIEHVSYFISQLWEHKTMHNKDSTQYIISHLEIMTYSNIQRLLPALIKKIVHDGFRVSHFIQDHR